MVGLSMNNTGQIGEELAIQYLTKKGYYILDQNFKVPFGEIDIITEKNNCICFVEVKCRKSKKYGLPEEAITSYKKKKIIRVAQYYIKKKHIKNRIIRFDVVSIQFDQHQLKAIRHITNAFIQ
jgi:putative endonuclease